MNGIDLKKVFYGGKNMRNPNHDRLGVQCVCKKCRIYREYEKKKKESEDSRSRDNKTT